jgi:hypothetical protein
MTTTDRRYNTNDGIEVLPNASNNKIELFFVNPEGIYYDY